MKFNNSFRSKVEELVKNPSINFELSNDFILKSILAIVNHPIRFDISNFAKIDKDLIETNWDKISTVIIITFQLLFDMGYTNKSIKAENLIIPVIYYLYYKQYKKKPLYNIILNTPQNATEHEYLKKERDLINQWFLLVGMKKIFGNSTDTRITDIRNTIKNAFDGKVEYFPLDNIKKDLQIKLDEEEIDAMLTSSKYGDTSTVAILSILQPSFKEVCEVDHLHPKSFFTPDRIKKNFKDPRIQEFLIKNKTYNNIANLAIIPKSWNREKKDKDLDCWVRENNINIEDILINNKISLELGDFESFMQSRRIMIKTKLVKILKIK